jgi:hypothetical protein
MGQVLDQQLEGLSEASMQTTEKKEGGFHQEGWLVEPVLWEVYLGDASQHALDAAGWLTPTFISVSVPPLQPRK